MIEFLYTYIDSFVQNAKGKEFPIGTLRFLKNLIDC